jgi:hypothetical protein
MNFELKAAIIRKFGSQVVASRKLGIREAKLSYIVCGHAKPSEKEQKALELAFGKSQIEKLLT